MSQQEEVIKGSCLCGEIEYQVKQLETKMGHCHCSMCRKFHGAAFSTFGEAKAENFKWIKGEALLKSFTATNGSVRQFCSKCGSSLTFAGSIKCNSSVEFTLGTLDTPITHRPDAHIYIGNKADWSEISDDLPQFKQHRTS